jgi:hypothetical protein
MNDCCETPALVAGEAASESYLAMARHLVAEHAELFAPSRRRWVAVAKARVSGRPPAGRNAPARRQLALPLRPRMRR